MKQVRENVRARLNHLDLSAQHDIILFTPIQNGPRTWSGKKGASSAVYVVSEAARNVLNQNHNVCR